MRCRSVLAVDDVAVNHGSEDTSHRITPVVGICRFCQPPALDYPDNRPVVAQYRVLPPSLTAGTGASC
jgi:hypothetical protein